MLNLVAPFIVLSSGNSEVFISFSFYLLLDGDTQLMAPIGNLATLVK